MWRDRGSTKIDVVGIPAGLNCRIRMRSLVSVSFASLVKQCEIVTVEVEESSMANVASDFAFSSPCVGVRCLGETGPRPTMKRG